MNHLTWRIKYTSQSVALSIYEIWAGAVESKGGSMEARDTYMRRDQY
jgi:hypothetical protein